MTSEYALMFYFVEHKSSLFLMLLPMIFLILFNFLMTILILIFLRTSNFT